MSYRKTYTGRVHYSGTVSYPSSESGGTKSYSGSVPITISIDVDTDEFDQSVSYCRDRVDALTASVAATEAAHVLAKEKSATKISNSIVKNFFDYLGGDLSLRLQELQASCESLMMQLVSYKDSCASKQTQMETDYRRISERYAKIFADLNHELESRIKTLDKAAMLFAEDAEAVVDRSVATETLGIATISAEENRRLEATLTSSHLKQATQEMTCRVREYLERTYILTSKLSNMLEERGENEEIMLPILYLEGSTPQGNTESKLIYAQEGMSQSEQLDAQLRSQFLDNSLEWTELPEETQTRLISLINSSIQSSDSMDDRVAKTILHLAKNQSIQTLQTI